MTVETRTIIELKDVKAFEFECPHCHVKTVRPINEEKEIIRIPAACQNCNREWLLQESKEYTDMCSLLAILKRYSNSSNSFILRLEIVGLAKQQERGGV